MKIRFFAPLTTLLTAIIAFNISISAQETKKEFLIIGDKMTNCGGNSGAATANCLQVKKINEEKFTPTNENIENFQFIAGYFYLLEVSVLTVDNPAAGASKVKYQLEKILTRVKFGDSSATTTQPNFSETEWKLTHIDGTAVKGEKAFIKFDEQKNTVNGNGGCNTFNGSITKTGNQLKIPEIFSTKIFCVETSINENRFFSNLMDRVTRYEINGRKLKLFAGDAIVLEFEAKNK